MQLYLVKGVTVTLTLAVVVAHVLVVAEKEATDRDPLKGFLGTVQVTCPSTVGRLLPLTKVQTLLGWQGRAPLTAWTVPFSR
jgi:hypothetical protein